MSKTLSTLLETVNEKMRTWQFHFFVACKIVELKVAVPISPFLGMRLMQIRDVFPRIGNTTYLFF